MPNSGKLPPLVLPFAALFIVSGACGLTYEVVWSRLLVQVFGVTAFAISTVLVSFMGGMALGAALLGRRADNARRPIRLFALLEAGVGAYALVLPFLLGAVDLLYGKLFPVLPEDAFVVRATIRFILCLTLLLVPTVLMGGTLPALGRGLLRRRHGLGRGIGLLYFVNTLGAAIGCYVAGFVLIPSLGLQGTTLLVAALNGGVAVTAWRLDSRPPGSRAGAPVNPSTESPGEPDDQSLTTPASWPLWVAGGSGFAALAFEMVWFRVLVMVFGSTVYSFSAMLSIFLLGIALGSLGVGLLSDRARIPVRLLALTQGAVAFFALAGMIAVNSMPSLFLSVLAAMGIDFEGLNRTKMVLSFVALFPPALAFGGTFPVAVRLAPQSAHGGTGSGIGRVYAWNTAGAILGSFSAGFWLLPGLGSEWTLRLVILLSLVLVFGSLLAEPGPVTLRWALPAGLFVVLLTGILAFLPHWDRRLLGAGVYYSPAQYYDERGQVDLGAISADDKLMTYTAGYSDTIVSFETPKEKFISVNGSPTASSSFDDMLVQRMLGHLPMALHPGPVRSACVVGLGSGVTAGAIAVHGLDSLTVVELERGVLDACRFFGSENHHVLDYPRLRLRIDDGRNFLKLTRDRFDVISSAPNFPSLTGAGALNSADYFELCKRRLAPGGVMCHWSPVSRLPTEDVKRIVGTFADVFPHVRVFSDGLVLILLGRVEPFPAVDMDEVSQRVDVPEVRASLAGVGVRGPVELLSFFQFDETEARRFAEGVPRNSDDHPRLEFHAPRGQFVKTVGPNLAELRRFRLDREVRADRLGVPREFRSSFLALAAAYDATVDGQILIAADRYKEGMETLLPAAEAGQRYARYIAGVRATQIGEMLQRQGNLSAAREQFVLARRYEPDDLDVLLGLGYVDTLLDRLDEAEGVLLRATSDFPRSAEALYRLGLLREAQKRPADVESLYRRAVAAQPEMPAPHVLLARWLRTTGRTADALREFEESIRLGERSEMALLGQAEILLAQGRGEEARKRLSEARRAFPSSPEVFDLLARAAEARGDAREAAAARRQSEEILRSRDGGALPAPVGSAAP